MTWISLLPWLAAAILGWILTAAARRYAISRSILDHPIARSSHNRPMPLGGGLAISGVALASILVAALGGLLAPALAIGMFGGGLAVAAVGWLDDRYELSARARLSVHFLSAGWFLAWTGGFSGFALGPYRLELGILGPAVAAVAIVWFINLYNFMDGIDGLAAGQAVLTGTIGAGLLAMAGRMDLALIALCISGGCAGFLAWNWAPARIFMGDAGSGLLGFLFIGLAMVSEASGAMPLVAWLILLGAFIFDATVTLLRRVLRGENWREGHRLHAFQRALTLTRGHGPVAAAVLGVSAVLGVVGVWAAVDPLSQVFAALVCLAVLAVPYLWLEALVPMVDAEPEIDVVEALAARTPEVSVDAVPPRRSRQREVSTR